MPFVTEGLTAFILVGAALIVLIVARPSLTAARGGKILAFLALFIIPLLATAIGTSAHLEQSKSTSFCLSCHVMEPYGESLRIADEAYLPAKHFQDRLVPRDNACFTCHTTYTMFGDFRAKLQGMQHVYVYYLGSMPEKIQLYEKYNNRECLHCHAGARKFEELAEHKDLREELEASRSSCLDCHEYAHRVHELPGLEKWKETGE